MNLIMLDNRDSFVYNLVDALHKAAAPQVTPGHPHCDSSGQQRGVGWQSPIKSPITEVYRNSLPAKTLVERAKQLDAVICLSPGPGTPEDAGCMMELIGLAQSQGIPLLGICLGFQALISHSGGTIERVGPTHGESSLMTPTPAGITALELGEQAAQGVPIARYHSLGTYALPAPWEDWGSVASSVDGRPIKMAAGSHELRSAGFQFHPESILTQGGENLLRSTLKWLQRL